MKIGIALKIDVTKLDKARFFKGQKGTYADLTTFIEIDEEDQYGNNGFITHEKTKEEKEAKTQLPIVGNVKVFWKGETDQQRTQGYDKGLDAAREAMAPDFEDDDVPF